MSHLNILHALPSLGVDGGGPPRSVSQLCGALAARGLSVSILSASRPGEKLVPIPEGVVSHEVDGDSYSAEGRIKTSFLRQLDAVDKITPLSILHQHGIWLRSSREVIQFATKRGDALPLVLSPRGMLEPWSLNHSKWKKRLAWVLYQQRDLQRVTAFHATAESEAETIRRLGFKQPIAVIPNGIVLPDVTESSPTPHAPRSMPHTRTALFLSRINPKKGVLMLLDAWKNCAPDDYELIIAGNDDSKHLPVLRQRVAELGLNKSVSFVGPLFGDEQRNAYLQADIFVLPSYSENFGIVVAEALGYQVPVLTTTGCPWSELKTENCGWWVEPTSESIEQGLRQAFGTSSSALKDMGLRGRKLVQEKYTWPSIATAMDAFYRWLNGRGERPDFVV